MHQVNNSYFTEGVQAIRVGDLKLIRGPAGDNRTIAWPERSKVPVPLGKTGAGIEEGPDHVRCTVLGGAVLHACHPYCLFNITADEGETEDLAGRAEYRAVAESMMARLDWHGATGPPHAYIWPNLTEFAQVTRAACPAILASGSVQPIDV